jgi:hypothetical protein
MDEDQLGCAPATFRFCGEVLADTVVEPRDVTAV